MNIFSSHSSSFVCDKTDINQENPHNLNLPRHVPLCFVVTFSKCLLFSSADGEFTTIYFEVLPFFHIVGNCTVGNERQEEIGRPDLCVPCKQGTYAPFPQLDDCYLCALGAEHWTSARNGSSSAADCYCTFG